MEIKNWSKDLKRCVAIPAGAFLGLIGALLFLERDKNGRIVDRRAFLKIFSGLAAGLAVGLSAELGDD